MKCMDIIRILRRYFIVLLLFCSFSSCKKNDYEEELHKIRGNTMGQDGTNLIGGTCFTNKSEKVIDVGLEEKLNRLLDITNGTFSVLRSQSSDFVMGVLKNKDIEKAYMLCDRLIELSIAKVVTNTEYNSRQNELALCWYNARNAFIGAMQINGDDFEYWDKMFRFYRKYINEISAIEEIIENPNANPKNVHQSIKYVNNKRRYAFLIKDELKTWVRVMRDFEFPKMSKDYTSEQKEDILRRFKEVEKYTVTPPHYPGGRGVK